MISQAAEDLLPEIHKGVGDSTLAAVGRQRRTACRFLQMRLCPRGPGDVFLVSNFPVRGTNGWTSVIRRLHKAATSTDVEEAADESVLSLAPPTGGLQRVLTCLVEGYLLSLAFTCLRPVKGGVLLCSRPCISLPDKCPK